MKYFFYNIYGDADTLVNTAPEEVFCVKYGWDKQSEDNRNTIVSQLGIVPSSLPCLMYYREEKVLVFPDGEEYIDSAGWKEVRVCDIEQPWTWEKILSKMI